MGRTARLLTVAALLLSAPASGGERIEFAPSLTNWNIRVATDGETLVAGSFQQDAAHVFRFDGSGWSFEESVAAFGPVAEDNFGGDVALAGDLLAVADPSADDLGNFSGAVYLFRFDGTEWAPEQQLLASNGQAGDHFGVDVAVGDGVVAVGSSRKGAYLYRLVAGTWVEEQKLPPPLPQDGFGAPLSLSGDALLVAASQDDARGNSAGAAYIYRFDGTSWLQEQRLEASDASPSDAFGISVALSGDVALVGAPGRGNPTFSTGAAYVFRRTGGVWTETQTLTPPDQAQPRFGLSVALDGTLAVVARTTAEELFVFRDVAGSYVLGETLTPLLGIDPGSSLAVSGSTVVAGAGAAALHVFDVGACGNGRLSEGEACDDGNTEDDDGCNASCVVEGCSNGSDDDGDGFVDLADPGCDSAEDLSERSPSLACDNGNDDDGDGYADFPADPVCQTPAFNREASQCQDGINNDFRPGIDFDGGASRNGGVALDVADPQCVGRPWYFTEQVPMACGLGFEIAFALAPLLALRRRRSRRTQASPSL